MTWCRYGYRPPALPPIQPVQKKCIECPTEFLSAARNQVRCPACQSKRREVIIERNNARAKQRKARRA